MIETQTQPTALVVFESMFDNTARVAHAVAEGLRSEGVSTEVGEVSTQQADIPRTVELLVLGAPTHAFSMSRPSTRADAVRQGAPAERAGLGMREWLGAVQPPAGRLDVAVFDTRVGKVRRLPMAAGPSATRLARRRGFTPVGRPTSFLVEDIQGPLLDGELERATAWGKTLADRVRNSVR
jgi:hypothetical protein